MFFAFFFASGFCSLLYQVVWLRLAFASFGVITPVLSVVISVFMAGLFIGTWAAGRFIGPLVRATRLPPLAFYALAELVAAAGAFAVPRLFAMGAASLEGSGASDSLPYLIRSAFIIAASIFPWCVAMGATVPAMLAHLRTDERRATQGFSYLYLANVLGALFGVLLTALVLVEALGLHGALHLAAGLNVLVALAAGAMAMSLGRPRTAAAAPAAKAATAGSGLRLAVLFMTGATSMAMEVVWTRAFTPVLLTQVYSFALILFAYLLATWIGSWLYRRHLALGTPVTPHEMSAWLAVSALLPLAVNDPRLGFGATGALLSIFPFCLGLGYLTPLLVDRVSGGEPEAAGSSYALNILGSCLGPLVASYLMLPWLGVKGSLALLALPYAVMLVLAWPKQGLQRWGLALAGILALGACLGLARTHEDRPANSPKEWMILRDHTATIVALSDGARRQELLVNGIGITYATTITKCMAHLPCAYRETPPANTLAICMGMGTTFRALASWGGHATVAELVPSVRDTFGFFFQDAQQVLARPGVNIVIDDGRRFLKRSRETFNVITLDPPPPVEAAASSLLYSEEFYEAVKDRLAPDGILQQWVPGTDALTLQAMLNSLRHQFPYLRMYRSVEGWGYHFLASRQPLPDVTAEQLVKRMPKAAQADLVEWAPGVAPLAVMRALMAGQVDATQRIPGFDKSITDDRPYNEYYLFRTLFPSMTLRLN